MGSVNSRHNQQDWVDIRHDGETGIETIQAHFTGHAYDPHDHDELLLGVTQQGLQRFQCNRFVHTSCPGRAILIEPGAMHDGHATQPEGFTYAMIYLPQPWVATMMQRRKMGDIAGVGAAFRHTLTDDPHLITAISQAWCSMHYGEGRLARDEHLDNLMTLLSAHLALRKPSTMNASLVQMNRVCEYLRENMAQDIGLDTLSRETGLDRFRLSRQFKKAFGQSPHAWLVRLRLRTARRMLAQGITPVQVASLVGFADQSHLGRWFQRAYRVSPAAYQRKCTNVLD
ncbi:AraC family transcriptional regulator [Mangrovibacter phragmitis]|uniref:AraC family transcriptional regulator n=1 Tax=Mangrovibacter phragmitis TaxID=1691903 RepID=A0A1B7L3Z1_9ENTR|nr:AraC family transcriptional regulator [Mangrovibacter phragmitis]OAT76996.1 AraC family transcriptional regulator [Mangrovibacter phragmitis]